MSNLHMCTRFLSNLEGHVGLQKRLPAGYILVPHLEAEGQAVAKRHYVAEEGGICIAGYALHILQEELPCLWLRQKFDAMQGAASIFKRLLAAAGHDDDAASATLLRHQPFGMAFFNIVKDQ